MSPVDIFGIENSAQMKSAWVPLPAPGPPNRITRIAIPRTSCSKILAEHPSAAAFPAEKHGLSK
jgi:hypothetical protein